LLALAPVFKDKYYLPSALPKDLVDALGGEDPLATLTARYLKPDGTAARFEVIVKGNPYSSEAMDCVVALRALLPGGPAAVGGASVVMTDLRETINRDMLRAFAFVLLGIFAVLVFLLRALVSPIYLILTILFSYSATLGITRLLSTIIFGTAELTWWAPFFMFVMLVALGMDYNIFLMGRVKEEVAQHGVREGVHRAIIATGAIITSAGIIMAGTFSAMMSSVIVGLGQLGLAVSVGVLLDTFVIRTALVPAIVVWLDRWNWWPGRSMGQKPAGVSADEPA
jgi:RND superfamily putative drug exporter